VLAVPAPTPDVGKSDERMKGLAGANRSRDRNGHAAHNAWTGLREGVPEIPKLRSRTHRAFGAIEVAYHQFVPGEIETLPFRGTVINLHLSGPHRLVQRHNGRTRGL
jgi:hypothetical protein